MAKLSESARVLDVSALGAPISMSVSRSLAADGGRPKLLFVHGNPADMDDWKELTEHLGQSTEVVAVDLPGFGRSSAIPVDPGATLLDVFADCVDEAARQVGWRDPYYVVGHSHGAGVALTLAARHPGSVAGLVLVSSLGVRAHASYRQLVLPGMHGALGMVGGLMKSRVGRRIVRAAVGNILTPMFHPVSVSEDGIEEQMNRFIDRPETLANMALLAQGNPCGQLARDAERIRAPALFLHGEEDRVVPVSHAATLSSLVAARAPTTLERVPAAGHMLHRTHATEVGRLLHRWLAEPPRSSADQRTRRVSAS